MAAAFKIQRQRVNIFQQLLVHRAFAEFVEGHVELTLLLERQTQHAVGLGTGQIRLLLAALGDEKAFGGEQQMADHQQGGGQHQLDPNAWAHHQPEVNRKQCHKKTKREHGSGPRTQLGQHQQQIGDHQQ